MLGDKRWQRAEGESPWLRLSAARVKETEQQGAYGQRTQQIGRVEAASISHQKFLQSGVWGVSGRAVSERRGPGGAVDPRQMSLQDGWAQAGSGERDVEIRTTSNIHQPSTVTCPGISNWTEMRDGNAVMEYVCIALRCCVMRLRSCSFATDKDREEVGRTEWSPRFRSGNAAAESLVMFCMAKVNLEPSEPSPPSFMLGLP